MVLPLGSIASRAGISRTGFDSNSSSGTRATCVAVGPAAAVAVIAKVIVLQAMLSTDGAAKLAGFKVLLLLL
jgi:hypothetical protein